MKKLNIKRMGSWFCKEQNTNFWELGWQRARFVAGSMRSYCLCPKAWGCTTGSLKRSGRLTFSFKPMINTSNCQRWQLYSCFNLAYLGDTEAEKDINEFLLSILRKIKELSIFVVTFNKICKYYLNTEETACAGTAKLLCNQGLIGSDYGSSP